jgi:caffeoylshikimate esterase
MSSKWILFCILSLDLARFLLFLIINSLSSLFFNLLCTFMLQVSKLSSFIMSGEGGFVGGAPSSVSAATIWGIGIGITAVASLSPYLLLLITAALASLLPHWMRQNDSGEQRRKNWKTFADDYAPDFWKSVEGVDVEEKYWINERGMCMFTTILRPANGGKIKGVIAYCHGYSDQGSWIKRYENRRLVQAGYAVVTIDIEGHGRSDGLSVHMADWNKVIDDTSTFFAHVKATNDTLPASANWFLMGESMGGAISIDTYNRNKTMWKGVLLMYPMVKIHDKMKPPPIVTQIFKAIIGAEGKDTYLGLLPCAPSADVAHLSFKVLEKRLRNDANPSVYGRKPRLASARELLAVTDRLALSLAEWDAPFIVMHGSGDRVTDPQMSKDLFAQCKSTDKEIKIFDGLFHAMTAGEEDEDIQKVFDEVISWIDRHN